MSWRKVVATAATLGVPTPAFSTALAFYDGYRSKQLPANLLQVYHLEDNLCVSIRDAYRRSFPKISGIILYLVNDLLGRGTCNARYMIGHIALASVSWLSAAKRKTVNCELVVLLCFAV